MAPHKTYPKKNKTLLFSGVTEKLKGFVSEEKLVAVIDVS